jgi:BirA family transcriptional regulator, biotin operon repressor / biotin---[acetyl-CoA-carboxylase] ligase
MSEANPIIGKRRIHVGCVDSTNTLATAHAGDPVNHGLVVTAEEQTAGRGQYQRVWQAPPGSSALLSVLLFPQHELRRPAILTAWAAVSVCEALERLANLSATIKWPNDVLVGGKKICGILCEGSAHNVVVGIGLNAKQSSGDFAAMNLPDATSLALCTGGEIDVASVSEELIDCLDSNYRRLMRGEIAVLEAGWKERIGLIGVMVEMEKMDGVRLGGRLRDIALAGIFIECEEQLSRTPPEMVRHLRAFVG